ncbi:MAG: hypothetical protein EA402_07165 [Planctomycetota bacterium]|nr:MAG: hypothetical protein EA402_07165 [Planctomycetota bacterium]
MNHPPAPAHRGAVRMSSMVLIASFVLAIVLSFSFADDPYRLSTIGHPVDQIALAHRDSPYSHITWVISEAHNYAELRFFDKVEGGVCLVPSWADLAQFNRDGALDHLLMPADANLDGAPPSRSWPADRPKPNPGTLTKSAYVNMFSAGVLLNDRLIAEAGGDPRQAKANILVVGLGSGVGISLLTHHFPEASIAVVDIDRVVIDMVVDHYPFLAWLRHQQTSDGRPRLKMGREEAVDARQYIRHESLRNDDGRRYDLVIIDAFTDGSTIPPHLMTREFYEEVRAIMPDDGIVLSNIIGSYTGRQHRILGGSMRAQQDAGFSHVHNIPLMHGARELNPEQTRNNIVLASAVPIDPEGHAAGWQRLNRWQPYPELPTRRFISRLIWLIDNNPNRIYAISAQAPISADGRWDSLRSRLRQLVGNQAGMDNPALWGMSQDSSLIEEAQAMVLADFPRAVGWNSPIPRGTRILFQEIDWVQLARDNWQGAINESSRRQVPGRRLLHRADHLIGEDARGGWIPRVPRFTDARPNADLYNR